ncbi:MAG: conjugal transfer protein [Neisseriaceae bacterium]|nr:conjugal transfer protein [Neisseriaceae bacterium]
MFTSLAQHITDPRLYPATPPGNELLRHANMILNATTQADKSLSATELQAAVNRMLDEDHFLGLSVALSMVPNQKTYATIWQALNTSLVPKSGQQVQWFALPIIVVAGAQQAAQLSPQTPVAAINECFKTHGVTDLTDAIHWHPELLSATALSAIKASRWYQAKEDATAAQSLLDALPASVLHAPEGQSVEVVYALGYTDAANTLSLGSALRQAALPLMQVFNEHFKQAGCTIFANPLPPYPVFNAMVEGGKMRLQMALDVFAGNAIRAVRLQSGRVGVVIAPQEGGNLLFSFNATESNYGLPEQVFAWPLSPLDNMELILQNVLELLVECQVEHVRLCQDILPLEAALPSYEAAVTIGSVNPLTQGKQLS